VSTSPELARIVVFFQTMDRAALANLASIYTEDAAFKDPFNEVAGLAAIGAIYAHMFEQVSEPRFVIRERLQQDGQAFLTWDFLFRMRRFEPEVTQVIHGATHLRLAQDGRITAHRDYWDAAEELYEKLPVLGGLMRWLKARAGK